MNKLMFVNDVMIQIKNQLLRLVVLTTFEFSRLFLKVCVGDLNYI